MKPEAGKAGGGEFPFLDRVDEFVADSFTAAGNLLTLKHLRRTLFWLLELAPAAGEALRIAALAHDIERAFREDKVYARMFTSARAFRDPAFLTYHQERSAKIIAAHLAAIAAPPALRDKVFYFVSRHEIGGDPEADLLRDADSLSFFEVNTDLFVTVKVEEAGPQAVREKFDWMFSRITVPKARELCRPLYAAACRRLAAAGNPAGE